MSKEAITAVSTLFTFWPPLPPLRVVCNLISEVRSIMIKGLMKGWATFVACKSKE
jgi:hypothetical protein